MLRSLMAKLKNKVMLLAQVVAATANSTAVDLADYLSCSILVNVGDFTFTGVNSLSLIVQHSDTDVDDDYEAVGEGDLYAAEDISTGTFKILDLEADKDQEYMIHYLGAKRYVRVRIVEAGTVTAPLSITALLEPKFQPKS